MQLNKVQDKIIDEFDNVFKQLKTKFNYLRHLADLGNFLSPGTAKERTDEAQIKSIKDKTWLYADYKDGKVYYSADSDSSIIKGILSLYIRVFSGRTPEEIVNSNIYFTNEISLYQYLPMQRSYEMSVILLRMRSMAVNYKFKNFGLGE